MGILIPKYSNKKFGGGVKVFPMIIRGAGHSVQGVSLNQAALCYTQRLTGLTVLQPVEGVQFGFSSVCVMSAQPLHLYLALSRNVILVSCNPWRFSGSLRAQALRVWEGVCWGLYSPCQVKPVVDRRIGSFRQINPLSVPVLLCPIHPFSHRWESSPGNNFLAKIGKFGVHNILCL